MLMKKTLLPGALLFSAAAANAADVTATNTGCGLILCLSPEGVYRWHVAVDADAPVEYFNLQGMRVVNPSKGSLVIRRQGTKVAKVIF